VEAENAKKAWEAEIEYAKKVLEKAKQMAEAESEAQNANNSLKSVMNEFDGGFNIPLIDRILDIFDSSYFMGFINLALFSVILICIAVIIKYFFYLLKTKNFL
jgi:hypothetical protein